jgi:uncharacterized DUF497 family protein
VPLVVYDLPVNEIAREKLGRRGISAEEAQQLRWNKPAFRMNHHAPRGTNRLFLDGVTNGGRHLTLVVEPTKDPAAWRVITGWDT